MLHGHFGDRFSTSIWLQGSQNGDTGSRKSANGDITAHHRFVSQSAFATNALYARPRAAARTTCFDLLRSFLVTRLKHPSMVATTMPSRSQCGCMHIHVNLPITYYQHARQSCQFVNVEIVLCIVGSPCFCCRGLPGQLPPYPAVT